MLRLESCQGKVTSGGQGVRTAEPLYTCRRSPLSHSSPSSVRPAAASSPALPVLAAAAPARRGADPSPGLKRGRGRPRLTRRRDGAALGAGGRSPAGCGLPGECGEPCRAGGRRQAAQLCGTERPLGSTARVLLLTGELGCERLPLHWGACRGAVQAGSASAGCS